MIRTVLLDLDDTLLDFHKAEGMAVSKTLTNMGVEPTEDVIARYSVINKQQWELLELGTFTREEILVRRFAILFDELGVDYSAVEARRIYEHFLSQGHFFLPGAEQLLETLYGSYKLYLVSNGTGVVQDGRLQSAGISHYFEEIFISERVGYNKPSPEYFKRCFAKIPGYHPEETIILGDSLTSDILGGNNVGIHTCWFNPKGQSGREDILAEYEIHALKEFPMLLEQI